ncbi:MAG: hypothetical protein JWN44_1173 [Myxococcales bacterium]|nr:hypothetical protein [Myxococcales bacterium]
MYEVVLLLSRADEAAHEAGERMPLPTKKQLAAAIDHTRDWPGAAKAAAQARAAVKIVESLPSEERLPSLVARVADAVAKLPCVAVWWTPAERLVDPKALAAAARAKDPLLVAVQVRLFHVEQGRPGELVMDTIGLAPLGLPDVQCHFVNLDPAAMAALLEETAQYLYAEGDVISDEDTVNGLDGKPWPCRRETALVAPSRDVIDLTPPAAHLSRPR